MRIVIATEAPFPNGLGATSRLLSYTRGFVEAGREVDVLVVRPTSRAAPDLEGATLEGQHRGVRYVHASGLLRRPDGRLGRLRAALRGLAKALSTVRRLHDVHGVQCVVVVSNSALEIMSFFVLCRTLGIPLVQEKSEFPFAGRTLRAPHHLYARLYTSVVYRAFDGMFVMTEALRDYFTTRVRSGAKLLVVPMTVEVDRFALWEGATSQNSPYIAYCGDMSGDKDGVGVLIDAFSRIAPDHPEVQLMLIGDASDPHKLDALKEQARSAGIEDRVVFTGRVPRDGMPALLCGADVLALARPANEQAQGGFPTKLGEYLSTGKPVVVTRVGELDRYLTDGVDVFFSRPNDPGDFAAKLDLALSDRARSRRIGLAGQDVARATFDYRSQSDRLLDFLDTLTARTAHD